MNTQLILSLISGFFISSIAAYLGTLMLSKKMSVVAGPLAHLAFPGVALAIIYHFSFAFGVFPFVIFGAILIWLLEKKTKLPMENLTAVHICFRCGNITTIFTNRSSRRSSCWKYYENFCLGNSHGYRFECSCISQC